EQLRVRKARSGRAVLRRAALDDGVAAAAGEIRRASMIGFAARFGAISLAVTFILAMPRAALAQRELHWDRLVVDAQLDAEGRLHVTETQGMVFTGDWNGGERVFNIRPQQKLSSVRVSRLEGTAVRYMAEN